MQDPNSVSALAILFMVVTLLISFGVPIGLAIWAKNKYRNNFSFIPLLGGILGFVIAQFLVRGIIQANILPLFGWYQNLTKISLLFAVFQSYLAGLVEEPARFVVFAILHKRRQYPDGLSYGIGHGGIEAILIVGLTYVNNLVLSLIINSGGSALTQVPASLMSFLTTTTPYIFGVAGLERVFAIALQIALSLFVLKGFQVNKKWLYLVVAILIHGTANFGALYLGSLGKTVVSSSPELGSIIFGEGFLLIVAVLSVLFIVGQAKAWRKSQPAH